MNTSAWITLGTIVMIIVALVNKRKYGPDLVMAGGLVILMITGVVGFEAATEGFSGRPILMLVYHRGGTSRNWWDRTHREKITG